MVVVEERRGKKDLKYFEGYALEKTTLMLLQLSNTQRAGGGPMAGLF